MRRTLTLLLVFMPAMAQACSVCFGDPGSPMAKGFYWGILLLLALPFTLLASFVGYIVYHTRKKSGVPESSSVSL